MDKTVANATSHVINAYIELLRAIVEIESNDSNLDFTESCMAVYLKHVSEVTNDLKIKCFLSSETKSK